MSSISARSRSSRHRTTDRTFLFFLIGACALIIGLVAMATWAKNRTAAPAAAAPAVADTDLLPLADPVNPISGFHDMANLPQAGDERPRSVAAAPRGLPPQASVDLPLERWDWGTIPVVPPVQQTFPIQNNGNESLIISSVVTSCGCTVADLSSSVIPPGQRADLVATFDPNFHETSGPVTRLVWLKTNDPDMPLVELRMDANVVQ